LISVGVLSCLAALCIGSFFGHIYLHNKSIRARQSGEVSAEILSTEWGTCGVDFETMHPCLVVHYKYKLGGQERETELGFTGYDVEQTYRPSGTYKICYDPDNWDNCSLYVRDYQCGS
jgi:hypothetical protein